MREHTIRIVNGKAEFIYDDELADLLKAGPSTVTRVSHVEPHPTRPGWLADMGPIDGPVIGKNGESVETGDMRWDLLEPFATRQEALDAEREWLRRERGL